jgi:filamentous hemagglutinin family protein
VRRRVRTLKSILLTGVFAGLAGGVLAEGAPELPTDGVFTAGSGVIGPPIAGGLQVQQTSARGIIDWRTFSIGQGGAVSILNGQGATLNRVTSGQLSTIRGTLSATGSVYLVNPQGVVISGEGRILAGGAVGVLTRDISNADFLSGGPFTARGQSDAGVVNLGTIVSRNGDVFLVGSSVRNDGEITAGSGLAGLAAGDTVIIAPGEGVRGLYVAADSVGSGDISVTGRIAAAAAVLESAGGDVYVLAGNRSGTIQATGVQQSGGQIWLSAPEGDVRVGGGLRASRGEAGGDITVSGRTVAVAGSAVVDASGTSGGTVLVGVTAPGQGLSDVTTIASGARILAGGPAGGGMVETSGHLVTIGDATIRAGEGGLWLVDPVDLTIDAPAASTITSALNAGTNVTQVTNATGAVGAGSQASGPGDIIVAAPISWTGAGSLTLDAYRDVQVNAAIDGTGSGGLTLLARRSISAGAAIRASTLTLTATTGGITTTAAGALTGLNGVTLTSAQAISLGGAVSNLTNGQLRISGSSGVTVSGAVSGPTVSLSANGGDLTIGSSGSVSGTNAVTLGTTGNFVNNGGASAVGSSAGRWVIYSTSPTTDTIGGLAFDFIQYAASYPANGAGATAPAQSSGNGLLYSLAPTLSFGLTGAISKTYDGTTAATLAPTNILATGLVGADTLALSAAYASANAGEQIGVTASSPVLTNAGKPVYGYAIPTPSVTAYIGTILRRTILASIIGTPTKIYNRSTFASLSSANFQLSGFVPGEGATVVSTTGATYDSDQAGSRTVTAGLEVTSFSASGGTNLFNYDLPTTASGSGAISKATVRVAGVLTGNKTYDGATTADLDISQAVLFGQVAGDAVSLDLSAARGDYASANVGAGHTVTASGFALSGASAANYILVQPLGLTGSITARSVSIVGLSAQNKVYDGNSIATLNLTGLTLNGVIPGDVGQVSLTTGGASANFETANAGLGLLVSVSGFGLSGTKGGNYALSSLTLSADITPRPLTATITGNPTKVYNATTTATVDSSAYSLSGFVAGQGASVTSKATAYYDSAGAGARTVTASITTPDLTANAGTDLANYILPTTATGGGTITRAPVTFNIVGNPTKSYDASAVATLAPSNFQVVGLLAADSLTVTQTTGTYASANAGSWQVTADLTGKISGAASLFNNYTFADTATGTGSITPALLTEGGGGPTFNLNGRLVGNPTKVYDGTAVITGLTPASFVLTGLQGSDAIQVVKTTGAFEDVNAGVQRIRVDLDSNPLTTADYLAGPGTLLSNYVLPSALFGNGTITPKSLDISLTGDTSKTYNGSNVAVLTSANFAVSGLVGADSITVAQAAQALYDSSGAGARTITVNLAATDFQVSGSTRLSNYVLPGTVAGSGTILQAPLRVLRHVANNKTYDGSNVANLDFSRATLFGAVAGDPVSLNTGGVSATFSQINAGSGLGITVSGLGLSGSSAANYALTPLTGLTARIAPRELSVSGVFANSRSYNAGASATLNTAGATLNGVLPGDVGQVNLNLAGVGGVFASINVRNSIRVTASGFALNGEKAGNYSVAQPAGLTANITQASLTATVVATPTKTYDGTTSVSVPVSGISISGFFGSDGATVGQYAGAAFSSPGAAGSVGLTVTLSAPDLVATGATDLSNYQLPTTASGIGVINRASLAARVVGRPTKVFDGGTAATVSAGDFVLAGFVSGQGASINATSGNFSSPNAGERPFTVTFSGASDFTANAGTSLANYVLPGSATGAGTITPRSVTVSILGSFTKIYDATTTATLNPTDYTVSGTIGADTFTVTKATGTYSSADAGSRTVTVSLTAADFSPGGGALASNYAFPASATGVGQIDPKALTLSKVQRVYNGLTTLAGSAYTLSGVIASDTGSVSVDASAVSGTFDTRAAGTSKLVTLTGVSLTGARSANYTVAPSLTNGAVGVITPATVSFTGPTAISRVYDATRDAQIDNSAPIVWTGLYAGDDVSLDNLATSGLFDTKHAGVNKPVTVSAYTLMGADAGNYALAQPSGITATITPLPSMLAITSVVKTYDGTTALPSAASAFTLSGVLPGDSVTVASVTGAGFATSNVATGLNVSISTVTLGGADGGNYVAPAGPATPNTIGTINPRSLVATITGNPTKTYDGGSAATLTPGNFSLSGLVGADGATVTKTTGSYDSANAGSRTISTTLAAGDFIFTPGTNLSNYILPVSATGVGAIDARLLTASIVGSPTKVYDATTAATLGPANFTLTGFIAGEGATITKTSATYSSANAGDRTVTASLAAGDYAPTPGTLLANYVLPTSVSGSGLINQKALAVTIVSTPTKVYDGDAVIGLTPSDFAVSGFVGGQTATVTKSTGAFDSANAGPRTATASLLPSDFAPGSGTNLANYVLPDQATGTGIISARMLSVALTGALGKTYDGGSAATLSAANFSLTGFASGQSGSVTRTLGTYDSPNAGARTLTVSLSPGDFSLTGGVLASNYLLPTSVSSTATIAPRALTASIVGRPSKVYDGTTAATLLATDVILTGFVSGEGATVTGTSGSYDSSNAGARTITTSLGSSDFAPTGGTLLSNYALPATVSVPGTILQRDITVAIVGNPTKTYDGSATTPLGQSNFSVSGLVPGEALVVTKTTGVFSSADAGSRTVTTGLTSGDFSLSGGGALANYALPTTASGLGTIDRRVLSAAIIGTPARAYDGSATAFLSPANIALSGFVSGEGASISNAVAAYGGVDAGTWNVSATFTSADFAANAGTRLDNYILPVSAAGIGRIDPRTLTLSLSGNYSKTYDGVGTAALAPGALSLSGFAPGEGGSVSKASGNYDSPDAGARVFSVPIALSDYVLTGGAKISNYLLPTLASVSATISPRALTVEITGTPTRSYDGTNVASLSAADFRLSGFLAGQGGSITQTRGTYASADAGQHAVIVNLGAGDVSVQGDTRLSNYSLPSTASGVGRINPAVLTAAIIGTPAKVYDGGASAELRPADFRLSGFVAGQGATVTQTRGTYASPDAGERTLTASLAGSDFSPQGETRLSNYVLPTSASGTGRINPSVIGVAIVGNPTKPFDGDRDATLSSADYEVSGLVSGQAIRVTQTLAVYDAVTPGRRTLTATLAPSDFAAGAGVSLSNYVLPTLATGPGTIEDFASGDPIKDILIGLGRPDAVAGAVAQQASFAGATPRVFVPFPAPGVPSTLRTSGLASLPLILQGQPGQSSSGLQGGLATVVTGAPVINAVDTILLQGAGEKSWTIFIPMAADQADGDGGDQ